MFHNSVNEDYPDYFIQRFDRSPKKWTITQIHDIWVRLKNRNSKRYKDISDHLKKITETFPCNGDKEWNVYYYKNGNLHGYNLSRRHGYDSGLSYSHILPKGDEREFKINLIDERGFILGQEMNRLCELTSRFEYGILRILCRRIDEHIREKQRGKKMNGYYSFIETKRMAFIRISGNLYLYNYSNIESPQLEKIVEKDIYEL
jgi:hypothetical protein